MALCDTSNCQSSFLASSQHEYPDLKIGLIIEKTKKDKPCVWTRISAADFSSSSVSGLKYFSKRESTLASVIETLPGPIVLILG